MPTRFAPNRSLNMPAGTRSSDPLKQRHRDDEPFLHGREADALRDENAERAEQHPEHEAEIEVQEAGDQCRKVPRFLV